MGKVQEQARKVSTQHQEQHDKDCLVSAQAYIDYAAHNLEAVTVDPLLTDAVLLLGQAKGKVQEFLLKQK